MLPAALLSTLHLFALAIGLPSVFLRARALGALQSADEAALKRVFVPDNLWALAALLWLVTGLARAFGPYEKGSAYYLHSGAFWLKLTLFGAIFALELYPMVTLIRWRRRLAKKQPIDISSAKTLATLNRIQVALTAAIPFVASAMARGIGFGWSPLG